MPDRRPLVVLVHGWPATAMTWTPQITALVAAGHRVIAPDMRGYGEDRIMVRWNKTRWRCREDYCGRGSFTESIAQVPAWARTTRRLRTQISAAVGDAARSVAEVAAAHSVSWPTAHRAFVAHAEKVLAEPQPTSVLGIDETRRGKPRWERCAATGRWVRVDPWDTGFVDLAGDQGLLGQREGRTGAAVVTWLAERSAQFREGIELVAIDPAAAYASAIRTPGLLPNATLVVDHFHLVALANDALTKVRRRVTWDLRDRRGRRIDPEWANRRRLLRARERLSDKSFAEMWNAIVAEDDTSQILSAWIANEELRTLLSTVRVGGDPHLTRHRLHRFLAWCNDSQIPELLTLAATIVQRSPRSMRPTNGGPRSTRSCRPGSPILQNGSFVDSFVVRQRRRKDPEDLGVPLRRGTAEGVRYPRREAQRVAGVEDDFFAAEEYGQPAGDNEHEFHVDRQAVGFISAATVRLNVGKDRL